MQRTTNEMSSCYCLRTVCLCSDINRSEWSVLVITSLTAIDDWKPSELIKVCNAVSQRFLFLSDIVVFSHLHHRSPETLHPTVWSFAVMKQRRHNSQTNFLYREQSGRLEGKTSLIDQFPCITWPQLFNDFMFNEPSYVEWPGPHLLHVRGVTVPSLGGRNVKTQLLGFSWGSVNSLNCNKNKIGWLAKIR